MEALTERQNEIYSFIVEYRKEKGYSPTYREIGAACNLSSRTAISRHIDILVKRGYLDFTPKVSRSLVPKK